MLFSVVRHPAISTSELNDDLQLINNWACQWELSFNPQPNKQAVEILFSKMNKCPVHHPTFFNVIEVTRVDEHKHLGWTLHPKLTFEKLIISKSRKNISILKHFYPHLFLIGGLGVYYNSAKHVIT